MAGGVAKYRHLNRTSAHRQSLLRNLVTSLFRHEAITTTWGKAKEAQRIAEKLVTLGKRNTAAARRRAGQIFFDPVDLVPKLFDSIAPRYASRPGGYTRCLRTGPRAFDSADGAILSLVDGPRDMRYFQTAQTVARDRLLGVPNTAITEINIRKCCQSWRARRASAADRMEASNDGTEASKDTTEPSKDRSRTKIESTLTADQEETLMEEARAKFEETVQWFLTLERLEEKGTIEVTDPTFGRGQDALSWHRVPDAFSPSKTQSNKASAAAEVV